MTYKRYAVKGDNVYGAIEGLLNINFASDVDAKLCCKLLNKKEKEIQEVTDKLNEIFKWHKEHYGKSILDERMNFNSVYDNEIERLEQTNRKLQTKLGLICNIIDDLGHGEMQRQMEEILND